MQLHNSKAGNAETNLVMQRHAANLTQKLEI